ncbi:hypothetical protein KJ781_02240 [Patescibacteria group bacterium]|nr:hypothetical protein [Patescibacteria group bacterium]MBU1448594.1 hypothetical protein [Patescibacteria group bacterium]MBU2612964.1 hypothetical protein [Patescibacteria group bacterium]
MNDTSTAVAVTQPFAGLRRTYRAHISPTIERATFTPLESSIRRRRATGTWKPPFDGLEVIRIGSSVLTDTVLQDFQGRKVRPATAEELFYHLREDPYVVLRRHAPLAALGSVTFVDGYRHVLVATRGKLGAGLLLHRYDGDWGSIYSYLVAPILQAP